MINSLIAKPVTKEFWIVTDGKEKVGNIIATGSEYEVKLNGEKANFKTTKSIQKLAHIEFQKIRPTTVKKQLPFAVYPTEGTVYNSILDIKRGLHLFTTAEKSKCYHAAGWFSVKQGNEFVSVFCPKYIFIQRYPYSGPFKTKTEADNVI